MGKNSNTIKYFYICYTKFLSVVFTFLFVAFLATPTVVGMIDNQVDTSYFYSMSEEEEHETSFGSIESIQTSTISIFNLLTESVSKQNVLIKVNTSFDNLAHQIFSPPPNHI